MSKPAVATFRARCRHDPPMMEMVSRSPLCRATSREVTVLIGPQATPASTPTRAISFVASHRPCFDRIRLIPFPGLIRSVVGLSLCSVTANPVWAKFVTSAVSSRTPVSGSTASTPPCRESPRSFTAELTSGRTVRWSTPTMVSRSAFAVSAKVAEIA